MNEFSIPGSEPDDTTLGAFDLGPYSTVSQVTVPRISLGSETTVAMSGISGSTRLLAGVTTTTSQTSSSTAVSSPTPTGSTTSASSVVQPPSSTVIAQVTEVSKAGRRANRALGIIIMIVAGILTLSLLI